MLHLIIMVTGFEIAGPYRLKILFEDGLKRSIDFRPLLAGRLFGPLRDLSLFNAVSIDPEAHTLVWPNGADFDLATLHDWPAHEAGFIALVESWVSAPRP
jgi:hypothetical protein